MRELINANDKYKMNWAEGHKKWGSVICPHGIIADIKTENSGENIIERYTFTNITDKDITVSDGDIGIYTTFNDNYENADVCMTNKCHTHIWCGENVTYVMALRMGGEVPHLGLVLTEGSICGYSVERDLSKMSNDRGDFIMHPSAVTLAPFESFAIEWVLFWHDGKEDFYKKLKQYCKHFIDVKAQQYVLFGDEKVKLSITANFDFDLSDVKIKYNGGELDFNYAGGEIILEKSVEHYGENTFDISISGVRTKCSVYKLPELSKLTERRCEFIADNQQYYNEKSHLDGAYLIYDNEEGHIFYNERYDYNSARERVGMGLLMAKYLQHNENQKLRNSLAKYIEFVKREVVDVNSGTVYNDYMRDDTYFRLYNYPWYSLMFIELYKLDGNRDDLVTAYKILCEFYRQGGEKFYAIEVPIVNITECMEKENMTAEKDNLMQYVKNHGDVILKNGTNYPAHEVNYEQSIAAPAVYILLQVYQITNEAKYLDGAEKQLAVLELFNGTQPDYHLNEVAIRHWDGYWFGKRQMYGDTYPHYWSSLTGNVFYDFAKISGDTKYMQRAEKSYRGSMSLFNADGSASCAFVYPMSVNGKKAHCADPYANDQDWGLYFMLRYMERVEG